MIDNISPTKYAEYLAKFPEKDSKNIPKAIPVEEKTLIIVSEEETSDCMIPEIPNANKTENKIIETE